MKLIQYVKHESICLEFVIQEEDSDTNIGNLQRRQQIITVFEDLNQLPKDVKYTLELNHHCYDQETKSHHMVITAYWLPPDAIPVFLENNELPVEEYNAEAVDNLLSFLDEEK